MKPRTRCAQSGTMNFVSRVKSLKFVTVEQAADVVPMFGSGCTRRDRNRDVADVGDALEDGVWFLGCPFGGDLRSDRSHAPPGGRGMDRSASVTVAPGEETPVDVGRPCCRRPCRFGTQRA